MCWIRARLYRVSVSMLRQLYNDASDTVLIENNGVAPDWGCNPFSSDSIIFNENSTTSVIAQAALFTSFMKLVTGWRVGARNDV